MTFNAQCKTLRAFLLFKFSLDPDLQVMDPGVGAKRLTRTNSQWHGFQLNDADMECLVVDVMREYAEVVDQLRPQLRLKT